MELSEKRNFTLTYDMPETEEHTIDAETLANSLKSMSSALKQANKILNGEDAHLKVEVKAHKESSFAIEFVVDWLHAGGIDVLKTLGIATASTVTSTTGVISLIKKLRNRPIVTKVKIDDSEQWKFTLDDGTTVECSETQEKLISNHNFLKQLDTVINVPTRDSDTARVVFSDEDGHETPLESSETSYFKAPPKKDMQENVVHVETKNIVFTNVNLEGKTGWKARLPSGDIKSIKMQDEAFLERIKNRERPFLKGDMFEVKMKTEERFLDGKSTTTRTIIEVLRHRVEESKKLL